MGSLTERKGLYKPSAGERGYDDEFAETMDTLDAEACFVDLEEVVTALWTFKRALKLDPPTAGPPLQLGTAARGQLVEGLNAEQLQGRTPELLEIAGLFFAGNQTAGGMRYWMGGGDSATESHQQHLFAAAELLGLYLSVSFNSLDADALFLVRRNGAATGLSLTVASGSTRASSAATAVEVADRDLVSLRVETDAATSGSITFAARLAYRWA